MRRVACFNRRLRFSLTPKNLYCLYIFPLQPMKRKTYSYAVDETAAILAGGNKANALINGGESLLGQLVCLGGSLSQ